MLGKAVNTYTISNTVDPKFAHPSLIKIIVSQNSTCASLFIGSILDLGFSLVIPKLLDIFEHLS